MIYLSEYIDKSTVEEKIGHGKTAVHIISARFAGVDYYGLHVRDKLDYTWSRSLTQMVARTTVPTL